MVKKKISRFLTHYIRKLKIFHGLLLVVVLIAMIFFYYRITNLDRFIKDMLTNKTEWSLSEHNSLLSGLITELNKSLEEDKQSDNIEFLLMKYKGKIEGFKPPEGTPLKITPGFNIDNPDDQVVSKCFNPETLNELSPDQLNLSEQVFTFDPGAFPGLKTKLKYFQNDNDKGIIPRSFLFIPTQLVPLDENGTPFLPIDLKRDIVFSRVVESYLRKILDKMKDANQAYYIPLRGFVRICPGDPKKDAVEEYKGKLSYKVIFSDRSYFDLALKEKFHPTPFYIDTGGRGIVRTYSVGIFNSYLNIIGIVSVDVPVPDAEDKLDRLSLGSPFPIFKYPQLDFADNDNDLTLKNTRHNLLRDAEKKMIEKYRKQNADFKTRVMRFPEKDKEKANAPINQSVLKKENRIIYSVPINEKRVAFVIFDKTRRTIYNLIFLAVGMLLLVLVSWLIFYIYEQSKKRIKAEERQLDMFSHMRTAYVITNKAHAIIEHNAEFVGLIEEEKPEGKNLLDYFTESSLKDFNASLDQGKDKFECPVEMKGKKGEIKSAILINSSTEHPFEKGCRLSVIIESKNFESLVAEKYINEIAHNLKTPLHSILQIAGQLRRKSSAPRYEEYFKMLNLEIEGLSSVISRYLKVSQVEFKHLRPDFEKFDLSRLVTDICQGFEPLAKRKKLIFTFQAAPGVTIVADHYLLKVAIENVLDNALKYTLSGSISLSLYDHRKEARIVIEDTGIGIPEAEIESIFDKGFRSQHPAVRQNDGQGIGLYQVLHFLRLNDSKIEVKSVPERGTKFSITIPRKLDQIKDE